MLETGIPPTNITNWYRLLPHDLLDSQEIVQQLTVQISDHNAPQKASGSPEAQVNPHILQRQI